MRWFGIVAALVLAATLSVETAAADDARAYVTADPARSDRVAVATQVGRFALMLGDGCEGVGPGVNVVIGPESVQVVDPLLGVQDQVCNVTIGERLSSEPCNTGPDGDCDVAYD